MDLDERKAEILAILLDMFHNHDPAKIESTCVEKQWTLENCIESLLENEQATSSQGAVPKTKPRKNEPPGFESSTGEQKIIEQVRAGGRVMVIMRGAPGSGKSYLARSLVKKLMPGIRHNEMKNFIFSTDDYFTNRRGIYNRQVKKLTDAHNDNQRKVENKAIAGCSPIIVDNTNLQIWEMMPYIQTAVKNGYTIELLEPQTPWKYSAEHLATKNAHGVPIDKIKSMLEKYEKTTAEQLVQMVKCGTAPQQNRANLPIRDFNSPQIKNINSKPYNSVHHNSKISFDFGAPLQKQNVHHKNEQNASMNSPFIGRINKTLDIQSETFRDITSRAETNQNILNCCNNIPYQYNNQVALHSTVDVTNISATETPNVSAPTNVQKKQPIEIEKDEFIELQLNNNILYQLNAIFGAEGGHDMNFFGDANEFLTIFVPRNIAKDIYMLCCQARYEKTEKDKRQVDESFAKLLQNTKYSEISKAPENIQEILDYEMALRLFNSENDQREENKSENLATYLKKLKVTEDLAANEANTQEKPSEARVPRTEAYDKENKCLALSDFEEYRNLAVHHCQLKAECYQKAKEMVQKGNNAVAGYYSQIAHFHKKKIDMYNERAANCIVEVHMLTSGNRDILDLHHLHVAEAIECLDLFLDQHISSTRSSTRTYKNIFIITGRGLHSTGGVSTIKNKVRMRLKERNLKWNEVNPGLLKVKVFSSSRFSK